MKSMCLSVYLNKAALLNLCEDVKHTSGTLRLFPGVLSHRAPAMKPVVFPRGKTSSWRAALNERSHKTKDNVCLPPIPLASSGHRLKQRSRNKGGKKRLFLKEPWEVTPSPICFPRAARNTVSAACLEARRLRDGKSPSAGVKLFIDISTLQASSQIPSVQEGFQTNRCRLTFSPACAGSPRRQAELSPVYVIQEAMDTFVSWPLFTILGRPGCLSWDFFGWRKKCCTFYIISCKYESLLQSLDTIFMNWSCSQIHFCIRIHSCRYQKVWYFPNITLPFLKSL